MARSITFIIDGKVDTEVTVTELNDGSLQFDLRVLETGKNGDLRALFFDLKGFDANTDGLSVASTDEFSGDVTDHAFGEGGVNNLGRDANVRGNVTREFGKFDVGVEFGRPGFRRDDIQETSFVLSYEFGDLSLDMLSMADFGIRYTSVGNFGSNFRFRDDKAGAVSGGVAENDDLAVTENEMASVNILANDTNGGTNLVSGVVDGDGAAFTATTAGFEHTIVVNGLELGVMTISSDGIASFDANGADAVSLEDGEQLAFSVSYTTTATDGSLATAQVDVTVTGVADGPEIILGTDDNDVIEGQGANELLTGMAGHDVFIFNDVQQSTITDFNQDGNDVAILKGVATTTTMADIQSAASQVNGDVVIDLASLGGSGQLTLQGKQLSDLDFTNEGVDFAFDLGSGTPGEMEWADPILQLDPSFDFGTVFIGSFVNTPLQITNSGDTDIIILAEEGMDEPFGFRRLPDGTDPGFPGINGNCGFVIEAGETCEIFLEFRPTTIGQYEDEFDLLYYDGAAFNTLELELFGAGN